MEFKKTVEKTIKAPLWLEIFSGQLIGELLLALPKGRIIGGGVSLLLVLFFVAFGRVGFSHTTEEYKKEQETEKVSKLSGYIDYDFPIAFLTIGSVFLVDMLKNF